MIVDFNYLNTRFGYFKVTCVILMSVINDNNNESLFGSHFRPKLKCKLPF